MNAKAVKNFVIIGHCNLESMLEALPKLLNAGHEWRLDDLETALHIGNCYFDDYRKRNARDGGRKNLELLALLEGTS